MVEAIRAILPPCALQEPEGYWSSALCLIDAVWSLGIRYGTVRAVVARYCTAAGLGQPLGRGDDEGRSHGIVDFLELTGNRDPVDLAKTLFRNEGRTSSKGGILKAEACVRTAEVLNAEGVDSVADLKARAHDMELEAAFRTIPGQGPGTSWRYLLMLAGVQDVKVDRMIRGFVADALNVRTRSVSAGRADELFKAAQQELVADRADLTMLALDNHVWKVQSGRIEPGQVP